MISALILYTKAVAENGDYDAAAATDNACDTDEIDDECCYAVKSRRY